ncbi:unnamed protein product [Sordaria macrospora k-hell]|uniref:WGS project CABT00000000 data, contig 2.78 n=1 Tax=Sordaria macrospora (strain ATCC MYA-333 / DSM 997 / K(L3346) / K-hell) TaxID=771870 RepID=F7WBK5_SORMK|nr:uncharacterized protein SMAC_09215 [Sordaria macrospora k-hell]CCC14434.1 unnamed protein product [Sordaria macrospora k-hell]
MKVTWKLPLAVLLFHFARPPLPSRWFNSTTLFILAHLLGDPIHTGASLLYTVAQCQKLTEKIRSYVDDARERGRKGVVTTWRFQLGGDNLWKELSIIAATYSEWGVKDIDVFLKESIDRLLLSPSISPSQALRIMHHLRLTASLLAADRSTYVLPIFITLLSFIIGIAGAYWRVADVTTQLDEHTWLNVEAYSIAISAPFLHLLSDIFLSALIGVPQTETSHPNILNDLHDKLEAEGEEWVKRLKSIETPVVLSRRRGVFSSADLGLDGKVDGDEEQGRRAEDKEIPPEGFDCRNGAILLMMGIWLVSALIDFLLTLILEFWYPSSPVAPSRPSSPSTFSSSSSSSLPSSLSSASPSSHDPSPASLSSFFPTSPSSSLFTPLSSPPLNHSCAPSSSPSSFPFPATSDSSCPLMPISLVPGSSTPIPSPTGTNASNPPTTPIPRSPSTYTPTLIKNFILSLSILTIILLIQLGIFNRCDCYSLWGHGPLGLPQIPAIEQILIKRIRGEWPAVTFGWVALEMVICGAVVWRYRDAFRVYLQRDDGASNGEWMPGFMVEVMVMVKGWIGGVRKVVKRGWVCVSVRRAWWVSVRGLLAWRRGGHSRHMQAEGEGFVEVVTIEGVGMRGLKT